MVNKNPSLTVIIQIKILIFIKLTSPQDAEKQIMIHGKYQSNQVYSKSNLCTVYRT